VALPSVIIVGCGAIGSATALEFARRGERVLAIDRGSVPNEHSSHHGVTRFFRMSTFEHPAYVPLLREAREGWDRLSRDTGCGMIETTGMLLMGPPGSRAVEGSTRACVEHGIPNEVLEAGELARRHATFRLPGNYTALWEPDAGCIACERAIRAMANGARSLGATIKEGARVLGWEAGADGVVVRCVGPDGASEHRGERLVITAGPWAGELLGDLEARLTVTRQAQFWLEPPSAFRAAPPHLPVWAVDDPAGFIFGFPLVHDDSGCKTCLHDAGEPIDPDSIRRGVDDADLAPIRRFLARVAPDLDTPVQRASVCMYTHSPDGVFIVDRHPAHENVALACGFTGHGFKFAPAIGRALADLVLGSRGDLAIQSFGLARLASARGTTASNGASGA